MTGCSGLHLAADSSRTPPPALAELQARLTTELQRLGKDPGKTPAAAPSGADNAVFDLAVILLDANGLPLDPGAPGAASVRLSWTERLVGDYDQNGEANVGDVSELGQTWQAHIQYDPPALHAGFATWPSGDPDDAGPGAANWRRARVDGDGGVNAANQQGEISIYDITPLAQHWHEQLSGYCIERGVNRGAGVIEWEPAAIDLGQGSAPTVSRPAIDDARPVRYQAVVPLSEPQFAHYYRVRAYDAATQGQGAESNVAIAYPSSTTDVTPPIWLSQVGVSALQPSHEQVTVQFGTAVDGESPPVSYTVYWQVTAPGDQSPFDYPAAQSASATAAPYVITGLTDGEYVRVAVRASDDAAPPNEEQNVAVLGATVGPTDVYPPEWTAEPGIAEVHYGNGTALLVVGGATDAHTDSFGTWSSLPVKYKVYHGVGETVNLAAASVTEVEAATPGQGQILRLDGLDTTADHWFAVALTDSANSPNESALSAAKAEQGFDQTEFGLPYHPSEVSTEAGPPSFSFMKSPSGKHLWLREFQRLPDGAGSYNTWYRITSSGPQLMYTHFFPALGGGAAGFLDDAEVLHYLVVDEFGLAGGDIKMRYVSVATGEEIAYTLDEAGDLKVYFRQGQQPLFYYTYALWSGFNITYFENRLYDPDLDQTFVLESGDSSDEYMASNKLNLLTYIVTSDNAVLWNLGEGDGLRYEDGALSLFSMGQPPNNSRFIGRYTDDYAEFYFETGQIRRNFSDDPADSYSIAPHDLFAFPRFDASEYNTFSSLVSEQRYRVSANLSYPQGFFTAVGIHQGGQTEFRIVEESFLLDQDDYVGVVEAVGLGPGETYAVILESTGPISPTTARYTLIATSSSS